MANANFDQILSTTLNNYMPKLVDNVFTARPLVHFLKEAGQVRPVGGGNKIILPIMHAQNQAAGSYSDRDTLSTTVSTGISAAEYDWAQYYSTITISGLEEAQNSGEEQIIDLLGAKVQQAEETILEGMNTMFYADGTGNDGKDWNGLGNLVAQNASSVGGIDPSAQTYWQSNITAVGGALTIASMATMFNNCSVGSDQPGFIITDQDEYEAYEALLQPDLRYTDAVTADAGFQNLVYKGKPVVYDTSCTAGYMFFLNPRYLKLVGHRDTWFRTTGFQRPENVDAVFAQILTYGQFTVSNRSRQGVLTGLTD